MNEMKINWLPFLAVGVLVLAAMLVGIPLYNVWAKELSGKAELAEATWNRKIAIEEAEARKESSNWLESTWQQ